MFEQISQIILIIRYVIIGIGVLGSIMLLLGLYRKDKRLQTRGGYFIILSIVLGVCGYLIYTTTIDRANQIIEDAYIMY